LPKQGEGSSHVLGDEKQPTKSSSTQVDRKQKGGENKRSLF
jgi:hypothetical protein